MRYSIALGIRTSGEIAFQRIRVAAPHIPPCQPPFPVETLGQHGGSTTDFDAEASGRI